MSNFKQFSPILVAIEKEINVNLKAKVPLAKKISQHILKGRGKKLRPLLFILSARLCGCETGEEVRLSPIFEYLHVASLLHDDVIDEAKLRRGKPAASILWGNTLAILAGDFLLTKTLELVVSSKKLRIIEIISESASLVVQGQILESMRTNKFDLTQKQYLEIIQAKTAALFASACRIGAILADAQTPKENALYTYGHNLGLAFQIIDDLLDCIGQEEQCGKPVGQDLKEGKVTLPLIYALKEASASEKRLIESIFKRRRKEDINSILSFIKQKKAIALTEKKAKAFIERAKRALSAFSSHPIKDNLYQLADFVVKRHS